MQLTDAGLEIDTLAEIQAELDAAALANIAPTLNLQAPDPIAVMNGVMAERLSSIGELVGAMYSGMSRDNASGDQLANLCLLTGTPRSGATATVVDCSITVDAAFTALAGTMFASVNGVPNILYTNVDDFSAGGAGTTTGVTFQCTTTGPNPAPASTLTVISSPLTHWTAITNPADGIEGQEIETDAELRISAEAELALGGATNAAAIRADILAFIQPSRSPLTIPGIETGADISNNPFTIAAPTISVEVLWNDTDAVDANGLPPHSIEVIAYNGGATDAEGTNALCALILMDKAAGINTYCGNVVQTFKTITDDQGISEAIYYTRPTPVPTDITVTVAQRTGHTVTEDEVRDAIMAYVAGTDRDGNALDGYTAHWTPGATAYQSSVVGAIFAFDLPGVANVTSVVLSAANVGNDIVPTIREIVTITDPNADITVTIV